MPVHLKALLVIVVLATFAFAFARFGACSSAMAADDFGRRRKLWFFITITAFLAHNYWIFAILAAGALLYVGREESNKLAMFFFLLFAVPMYEAEIGGLGVVKQLFTLDYSRLLALIVLLPALINIMRQPNAQPFGRSHTDKFLAGHIILNFALLLLVNTFTNSLRQGVFYAFVDIFLPYYVASRSIRSVHAFRDVLMSFAVAAMVLSAIAAFEFAKHWLLYVNLDEALGTKGFGGYLMRGDGVLRAQASTGQPIVLGYVVTVAAGFFWFLRSSMSRLAWGFGMAVLLVGILVPVSRGPWVGAVAIFLVVVVSGPSPVKRLVKVGLAGTIAAAAILATPGGEKLVDYLPFIGTVDKENVTFRQGLLNSALDVVIQNPFFGAFDYIHAAEFEELKQGNGFLDLVNTYVVIALGSGLVGLALFSGIFVTALASVYGAMRQVKDGSEESHQLGQVLLAVLIGVLVTILTVSSVSYISVIYWSLAGLCTAYARIVALAGTPAEAGETGSTKPKERENYRTVAACPTV